MKKNLLLINLGTPASYSESDVKRYLKEFLSDPFVIRLPAPVRAFVVSAVIVPRRAATAAAAYKSIWTKQGSPLLVNSTAFKNKLAEALPEFNVNLAMRYGEPALRQEMQKIVGSRASELYVWPLYPQYAESSTLTALEEVKSLAREMSFSGPVYFIDQFSADENVAAAWVENIIEAVRGYDAQKLVLSYHGLPIAHLKRLSKNCRGEGACSLTLTSENKNCYRRQAFATSQEIRRQLFGENHSDISFTAADVEVSFQSRLTRGWIKPFSDEVYGAFAKKGIKRILVVCPSFVADCLETLEEVAIRERRRFIEYGGEDLRLVPCLNDSATWVRAAAQIVRAEKNWKTLPTERGL